MYLIWFHIKSFLRDLFVRQRCDWCDKYNKPSHLDPISGDEWICCNCAKELRYHFYKDMRAGYIDLDNPIGRKRNKHA